jgi:DNA-binding SARP family transcriptional activator
VTVHPATMLSEPAATAARPVVTLFGGPYVTVDGHRLDVPEGGKRLLAYVCLTRGPVERRRVAGTLWPEGDDARAAGNLRSALWRLKGSGIHVLASDKSLLWVRPGTVIDVEVLYSWADRLVGGRPLPEDLDIFGWHADCLDLLPGWYEDWAVFEREHRRQLLLHALDALARHLVTAGRADRAVTVASAAVAAEPLRESAQQVLIEAHLAEGNVCEARRSFEVYRSLAVRELGVEPSRRLRRLTFGGAIMLT